MKTFTNLLIGTFLIFTLGCSSKSSDVRIQKHARNQVAILSDTQLGTEKATIEAVADAFRREGYEITLLSAEEVCDSNTLSTDKFFLYLIPAAESYPPKGSGVLIKYLESEGNLIIFGRPTLDKSDAYGQWNENAPVIETISPSYKTFSLKDIASLKISPSQRILSDNNLKLPLPAELSSCYARPEGKGFEHGYKWRWIPLVKALDKEGVERGTVVWMLLNHAPLNEGPAFEDAVRRLAARRSQQFSERRLAKAVYEGSVCAVCAIDDPVALREIANTNLIGDIARRISDGLFLSHAGSQYFSYWPDETVNFGAVAVNRSLKKAKIRIRISVSSKIDGEEAFQKESSIVIKPRQFGSISFNWIPSSPLSKSYSVTTEMLYRDKTIDIITHEMGILSTEEKTGNEFVTVKDGDFWLKGQKWYPMGINYWPRYYSGLEIEDLIYYWLSPGFYNPEEVERDLTQLESIGANFLVIRADAKDDRRTLLDFLRRCEIHGIKVLMSLSSDVITDDPHYFQVITLPYHFQEEAIADFISATRISANPTLLGYDLIWEPNGWLFGSKVSGFGFKEDPNFRKRWDKDWVKWIDDRYGSLANAEADWGMPVPRLNGIITSPTDEEFRKDGPWRVMIAAYRRFQGDLMNRMWNDATRKLRLMDPNHLITFRQGGFPSYDFANISTMKHIDFSSPEGYGFRPDDEASRPRLGFVNRWVHFSTGGKPYIWAEFGSSVWDQDLMQPDESMFDMQADFHDLTYRIGLVTGANGMAGWWWPGGYRVCEMSDYGIVNPDGTLRPSGLLLQKYTTLFRKPRTYPKSNKWFTMDLDANSGGLYYFANNEGREAYKRAASQGLQLGIRTPGTGTTSANTPLLAVGNKKYNGNNPPKYLNAEFNWFRIKIDTSDWINVTNGMQIRVPRNKQIIASVSVGNLQEATWLTPTSCQGKPGAVFLATTSNSEINFKQAIIDDTPYLQDADFGSSLILTEGISAITKVELQMTAESRAWFGEKLRFTLEPIDN